jgi:TetR/AcrR family transcriptional regulator, fatty acid metabolism regulator protein
MKLTNRQLEIIQASGRLITTKGLSGLTIKNLASEMDFVESALYRHFKSKEDILVLLVRYLYQNVFDRIQPILDTDESAEDKIRSIFESHFQFVNENRHFVIVMMSEGLIDESDNIKNEAQKILGFMMSTIHLLMEQVFCMHSLSPNLDIIAQVRLVLGGFRMTLLQWKLSNFQFDIVENGNQLIDNYFVLIHSHQSV